MRQINWRCRLPLMILNLIVLSIFLILPAASADEGNTQQKKYADELTPQGTLQELPSPPQQTQKYLSAPVPAPSVPENKGAINPRTGEYYPPSGKGAVNPKTGEYYPPSGQGVINPGTGAYYPHAR
ncbi:MAG: hypothetical protein ACXWMI_09495 [Syntrophales bacterium]